MKKSKGFGTTAKVILAIIECMTYHMAFVASFLVRYKWQIPIFNYNEYQNSFIYIMGAFVLFNILMGIYEYYNKKLLDLFALTIIIQFSMSLMIMAMTYVGRWFAFPRTIIFVSFLISTIFLFITRFISFKIYRQFSSAEPIMIVGDEKSCLRVVQNFISAQSDRYEIKCLVMDNFYENIVAHSDEVDIVYLADNFCDEERLKMLNYLVQNEKQIYMYPNFSSLILVNSGVRNIDDESLLDVKPFVISPEQDYLKRFVDIVVSLFLIILTSPIMIMTGLAIKFTSPGPIFYKQVRITKGQQEFEILKFRSMTATAEKESGPVLATANDDRVTGVGKFIRATRIDELPQLFNVLNGDMSLVGPRPERPFFVDQFNQESPFYHLRHNVRAGITGYAQVFGKYATDFKSKLRFDLIYIQKYSPILDLQIMLLTVKILFNKVSSRGLDEADKVEEIPDSIEVYR